MKIFFQREIREAYAYAAAGGMALHLCSVAFAGPQAPGCFRRGEQFAHLFDQNYDRLIGTAKCFGVKVVVPQHCGTYRQHVDLCGKPLARAINLANKWAEREKRQREEQAQLALVS